MKTHRLIVGPAVAALALAGCVTVDETSTPDGKLAHSVTCAGNALSWTDCHEKAASLCGAKGYEVVAGGPERGVGVSRAEQGLFRGTTVARNMVVQCKTPGP
jgi:hypothetical protein